jgi:hypothetical protein
MEKMVDAMSKGKMISVASKNGYVPTTGNVVCPRCTETAKAALANCHRMQAELLDRTIYQVPWVNVNCAMVFIPPYAKRQTKPTLHACACGWRKSLAKKPAPIKIVNKCAGTRSDGTPCPSILTKKDGKHTYCANCRLNGSVPMWYNFHEALPVKKDINPWDDLPEAPSVPVKKALVTCNCGTVLPNDRKKFCYTCRPKIKTIKEAASKPLVA